MHLSFKELKGASRLYWDYLYSFENLAEFYNGDFRQLSSFKTIREEFRTKDYPREKLVEILADQNKNYYAGTKTLQNIEALKDQDCCVVFTGQQIGLFGGPLYTLYKSLTAVKLAQKLSSELKVKIVPIFWMATDDHDFAEINHLYFVDKENKLVKLEYQPQADWNGYPASQIVLDGHINQTLQIFESSGREDKFQKEVIKKLQEFYAPGQPYFLAFARWMSFLLKDIGLVFLNPADQRLKSLLSPIFVSELQNNGNLQLLLEKASQRLERLNYHRQVHKPENATNIFYHSPKRVHITRQNGEFFWKGSKSSLKGTQLLKMVENSPQDFSANVLLRPVLESYLFPNLAHIAGPSEVAYFAQIKALHQELDVVMPVIYPRRSLTLVEPEIKATLAKLGVTIKEMIRDVEQAYNRMIEGKIPKEAEQLLNRTPLELRNKIESLGKEILKIQPGLKPNLEFTIGKIDFEFNKFKEKFFQAYKKQFKETKEELYFVRDRLYPQNTFQERIFNATHFLNRYGFEFIDYLYENLDLKSVDHQVLELNEG
jgi:bacillithiol biosynthesis cysteine-adding enzyme BshC